jgi:uncharacterized membrane protein
MIALAAVMTGLFAYLFFVPYAVFKNTVKAEDWPAASTQLNLARRIILVNLVLGLVTASLGSAGRYY